MKGKCCRVSAIPPGPARRRRPGVVVSALTLVLLFSSTAVPAWAEGEGVGGRGPGLEESGQSGASPVNRSAVFPYDHPVYRDLEAVRMEQGLSVPWTSGRFTGWDVLEQLEPVRREKLSRAGREAYDRIRGYVNEAGSERAGAGELHIRGAAESTAELYLSPGADDPDFQHRVAERRPFLAVPVEFLLHRSFYGRVDLDLITDRFTPEETGNPLNVPLELDQMENQIPNRSFALLGGEGWAVELGRDRFGWGAGRTGTVALSAEPDFHEYVRASFGNDRFRYTSLIAPQDPWLPSEEKERLEADDDDYDDIDDGFYTEWSRPDPKRFDERAKTLFFHRFEVNVAERARIALTEGIMYGLQRPDLRLFNPFFILHNRMEWEYSAAFLGLEAVVTPVRGVQLYAEYGMNQFPAPWRSDDIPEAWGSLAGAAVSYPVGIGYLGGYIEGAYMSPWFYVRENPYVSFHYRRRLESRVDGRQVITQPLGYRYGNDSAVGGAGISYRAGEALDVELDYRLIASGERNLDTQYRIGEEEAGLLSPTGTPEYRHRASLMLEGSPVGTAALVGAHGGDRALAPLRFGLELYVTHIRNYENEADRRHTETHIIPSVSYRWTG